MDKKPRKKSLKIIIGGSIIVLVIAVLIILATRTDTQYFLTVDELLQQKSELVGKSVRISGAVIGNSIEYNPETFALNFEIAQVSGDMKEIEREGGLAAALHVAVIDPERTRLKIVYQGIKPDLLKDEAQAILKGTLGSEGVFTASEILLKCPSKYSGQLPNQAGQ